MSGRVTAAGAAVRTVAPWLGSPAALWHKVRRAVRRRLTGERYRRMLAEGELLDHSGGGAAAPVSVVMPVFRVREDHLRAAIGSVRSQSHPGWELIVVDDASPDGHVAEVLAAAAREDPRIRVRRRDVNGGIAAASDDGVALARHDHVAFLDHDDLLHPRALELAGRFLADHPGVDWLFTDEDKVDERGRHTQPCLKPGFSHHLLLTFNYVAHLRILRRRALAKVGGHRPGFDGAQDYDLALRVLAAGGRFAHLPGVLYHWRSVPGSMARAAAAKPAAHERALRALAEHAATFAHGTEVSARVLLEPASLFSVRRRCDPALAVAVLSGVGVGDAWMGRLGRPAVRLPDPGDWPAVVEATRRLEAPLLLRVASPVTAGDLEELLALLLVPKTAVAAARTMAGRRVADSGWVAAADGAPRDPWRGQAGCDPGYLNLDLAPAARLLPPGRGWVAWREDLLESWEAAPEVPEPWRLAVGLHRTGHGTVVTPTVAHGGRPSPPPPTPAPAELPRLRLDWRDRLRL